MQTRTASEDQVIGSIKIMHGSYRNNQVEGTFDLVQGYKESARGTGFVTIREENGKRTRIKLENSAEAFRITLNAHGKDMERLAAEPKRGRGRPRKEENEGGRTSAKNKTNKGTVESGLVH